MTTADNLQRTDWFEHTDPTIPGPYEAKTGGGHIFTRTFDGKTWRSSITNEASSLRLPWRGVVPKSIGSNAYSLDVRKHLVVEGSATQQLIEQQAQKLASSIEPGDIALG